MNSALIYLCVIFCLSAEAKNKPGSMDIIKKATANVQLKYNPLPTNTQLSKKYQLPKMQTPINRSIKTSIARNEPLKTQLKYHHLQQPADTQLPNSKLPYKKQIKPNTQENTANYRHQLYPKNEHFDQSTQQQLPHEEDTYNYTDTDLSDEPGEYYYMNINSNHGIKDGLINRKEYYDDVYDTPYSIDQPNIFPSHNDEDTYNLIDYQIPENRTSAEPVEKFRDYEEDSPEMQNALSTQQYSKSLIDRSNVYKPNLDYTHTKQVIEHPYSKINEPHYDDQHDDNELAGLPYLDDIDNSQPQTEELPDNLVYESRYNDIYDGREQTEEGYFDYKHEPILNEIYNDDIVTDQSISLSRYYKVSDIPPIRNVFPRKQQVPQRQTMAFWRIMTI